MKPEKSKYFSQLENATSELLNLYPLTRIVWHYDGEPLEKDWNVTNNKSCDLNNAERLAQTRCHNKRNYDYLLLQVGIMLGTETGVIAVENDAKNTTSELFIEVETELKSNIGDVTNWSKSKKGNWLGTRRLINIPDGWECNKKPVHTRKLGTGGHLEILSDLHALVMPPSIGRCSVSGELRRYRENKTSEPITLNNDLYTYIVDTLPANHPYQKNSISKKQSTEQAITDPNYQNVIDYLTDNFIPDGSKHDTCVQAFSLIKRLGGSIEEALDALENEMVPCFESYQDERATAYSVFQSEKFKDGSRDPNIKKVTSRGYELLESCGLPAEKLFVSWSDCLSNKKYFYPENWIRDHSPKNIKRKMDNAGAGADRQRKTQAEIILDLIERFKEQYHVSYKFGDGWYIYRNDRYFEYVDEGTIEQMLDAVEFTTPAVAHSVIRKLEVDINIKIPHDKDMNHSDLMNLENGMYNVETGELTGHDPKYLSTLPIDIKFKPNTECPLWNITVSEWFTDPDDVLLLQEIMGYTLTKSVKGRKFFIFLGAGKNGKSVCTAILESIIGTPSTSHLELFEICERFKIIQLKNKLLNVGTDISNRNIDDTAILKKLVCGESITAERKGVNPIEFEPYSTLIFNSNSQPRFNESSNAITDRTIYLNFDVRFDNTDGDKPENKHLINELMKEREGIFLWMLAGLNRLKQNNWQFTKTESSEAYLEQSVLINNTIRCFVESHCEILNDEQQGEFKDELYDGYRNYCKRNGAHPKNNTSFYRDLFGSYPLLAKLNIKRKRKGGNANAQRSWVSGIVFTNIPTAEPTWEEISERTKHWQEKDEEVIELIEGGD